MEQALINACGSGHTEIVKMLLETGVYDKQEPLLRSLYNSPVNTEIIKNVIDSYVKKMLGRKRLIKQIDESVVMPKSGALKSGDNYTVASYLFKSKSLRKIKANKKSKSLRKTKVNKKSKSL